MILSGLSRVGSARAVGVAVFLVALGVRLLFWTATPDSEWAYSVYYKGDALTWLGYAEAIDSGQPFDNGLPFRPPGNAYLLALLSVDSALQIPFLRLLWSVLGALGVLVFYLAAKRGFGDRVALVLGILCAASTSLLLLSSSLNNEVPYALLVGLCLLIWPRLHQAPSAATTTTWSLLHAAATLIRVEHVLFFLLAELHLAVARRHRSPRSKTGLSFAGLSLVVFALALAPWQWHVRQSIRSFNNDAPDLGSQTEAAMSMFEELLRHIIWEPQALAAIEEMPAAIQRTMRNFISATVAYRGSDRVSVHEMDLLNQAFGSTPKRINEYQLVAIYGGLNFLLANNEMADGGFSRAVLDRPPPLEGGIDLYPPILVRGLPPRELALTYPPHLEAVNRGYRLGLDWVASQPGRFLRLAGSKLGRFWSGATLGVSGFNLPTGLAGPRRAVDLVVPARSVGVTAWQAVLLIAVLAGCWVGSRRAATVPWLLLLLSKLIVTLAFFGYARQGALVFPVIALMLALLVDHGLTAYEARGRQPILPPVLVRLVPFALLGALLVIEGWRTLAGPVVSLDGHRIETVDPFPAADSATHDLEVRF